jgi:hypothetical protein
MTQSGQHLHNLISTCLDVKIVILGNGLQPQFSQIFSSHLNDSVHCY